MRLHYLQHQRAEDPANILVYAKEKGFEVSRTLVYEGDKFPDPSAFDMLVVMGGAMGVYDDEQYPWLTEEKRFLEKAIENNNKVLGICLGAQLVSCVLGGKVYKNKYAEIGWFPVKLTEQGTSSKVLRGFPNKFNAFHWHDDIFEIPAGAIRTTFSEGCENQSFEYDNGRVAGLQFHIEVDRRSVQKMAKFLETSPKTGKYVQSPAELDVKDEKFLQIKNLLFSMLDKLTAI